MGSDVRGSPTLGIKALSALSPGRTRCFTCEIGQATQLWWSPGRRILRREFGTEADRADLLAASALTKRFSHDSAAILSSGNGILPDKKENPSGRLRVLQQADNKFFYTWEMCAAKVGFMKRLVLLTLLLSTLVLVYGTTRILTEIMILKSAPIGFVTGSIAEVLVPFALGIFIGALCDV